jgi:AraC-like DNA-binding protein
MSRVPYSRTDPDIYYEESLAPGGIYPHYHNMQQILLILEGAVKITVNKKEYAASGNSIFFISNLESHSVAILKYPYKRYVLSIPADFSFSPLKDSYFYGILLQRPENFSHMIRLAGFESNAAEIFKTMHGECQNKRPGWQLMIACQLARLLVGLYRFSPSSFPENSVSGIAGIVFHIQKEIAENFNKELSLEGFAEQNFVSKYHLSREFKRITGYNFREYLILYRISAAKDLLSHTDMAVADVCLRCGYPNVNHFIRIFKNTVGKTPYRYKKDPT